MPIIIKLTNHYYIRIVRHKERLPPNVHDAVYYLHV